MSAKHFWDVVDGELRRAADKYAVTRGATPVFFGGGYAFERNGVKVSVTDDEDYAELERLRDEVGATKIIKRNVDFRLIPILEFNAKRIARRGDSVWKHAFTGVLVLLGIVALLGAYIARV